MNAVSVPYRTNRPCAGRPLTRAQLGALAGSTKKRNGDAFGAAFPGVQWKSDSQIILPAKFGGITVNRDGFDELAGTWYGATYHPDGDQAGWQQKFDAALKKYGAFNAYYGVSVATPSSAITPSGPAPMAQPAPVPQVIPPVTVTPVPVPAPVSSTPTTLPATPTSPAITVNVPASVAPDQTSALIQQLIAQGANSQQAFQAALQSLAAQGVQPTPQVQQQVASDVANAAQPQQAGVYWVAGGAVALILFGILMSRGKRRR